MNEVIKALYDVMDWQNIIEDKPENVVVLHKMKIRRIKFSLESWENVCEIVESMIQERKRVYRKKWFASRTLLSLLGFLVMDLIESALPPKIFIEQDEREHLKSKECIEHINCIHVEEIKEMIESPITSVMRINFFLRGWEKESKREIESFTRKSQLKLEHDQYQDI